MPTYPVTLMPSPAARMATHRRFPHAALSQLQGLPASLRLAPERLAFVPSDFSFDDLAADAPSWLDQLTERTD